MVTTGQYRIPAARDAVWEVLTRPEPLGPLVPGGDFPPTGDGKISAKIADIPIDFDVAGSESGTVLSYAAATDAVTAQPILDELRRALTEHLSLGTDEITAEDEAEDRAGHRVDVLAQDLVDTAKVAEEDVEVAAARGFLGGPYMWGLLVILIGVIVIALLR